MNPVEQFIYDQDSPEREILDYLHRLICQFPDVQPRISFRIPMYYGQSWICYINPLKKGGVAFNISRANELDADFGILDFKNRKQVAGIELFDLKEIPEAEIIEALRAAIDLDKRKKYSPKKN